MNEALFLFIVLLVIIGLFVWLGIDIRNDIREEKAAVAACQACGWPAVENIDNEYACLGMEDGGVVIRLLPWVQENACGTN